MGQYSTLQLLTVIGTGIQEQEFKKQACCPVSALLKTLFSAFHFHRKPFLRVMHLKTSRGRGQLIQLNCRALCGKGVWEWWFNPEVSQSIMQMHKNPKPFNNILLISAGFFLLCRVCVCECIVCKIN